MPTCICKNMLQDHRKYGSITGSVLDSPMLHEKVVEVLCESNRHNKNVMLWNALLTNQQKNLFQVKKKKIKIKNNSGFLPIIVLVPSVLSLTWQVLACALQTVEIPPLHCIIMQELKLLIYKTCFFSLYKVTSFSTFSVRQEEINITLW